MRTRICVFVVLLVVGSFLAMACAGTPAPSTEKTGSKQSEGGDAWQKVVEAAKKEGKVVYYAAPQMAEPLKKAAETFKREYGGIEIQVMGLRGNEMKDKVLAEVRAGRVIADIGSTGPNSMVALKDGDALQKYGDIPNMKFVPKELVDMDSTAVLAPIYVNTYGILINTRLVKPEDEPKSWQDLLDPKWQGKLLADDPRAAGGGNAFFSAAYTEFGREYHEKLAKQQPHFTREYLENEKATARGDYPVYFPLVLLDHYAGLQGTPTKPIAPREGSPFVPNFAGIVKGSPHPNAARVLLNWMLSEEGQRELTKYGNPGLRTDIDLGLPKDVSQLLVGNMKLIGGKYWEALGGTSGSIQEAEAIYGR